MIMSLHPQHPVSPFAPFAANSTPSPSRKRHAAEPVPFAFTPESPHAGKRRRPNLANGLSGLSLDSVPPPPSNLAEETSSEGSISPTRYKREVSVEEIPDNRPFWSIPNHATTSSASSSTSDEGDSDTTYRQLPRINRRRKHAHAQQPDSIELPGGLAPQNPDVDVQDMSELSPARPRKRRGSEEEELFRPELKRRREGDGGMDLDMEDDDPVVEEIPRESRSRTRTEWYEPEKDRIVITSIGSPSSSRSSSRTPSPTRHSLEQPGQQGFTLSPSLLTHLLNSQRGNMYSPQQTEKGLVLYRPLGIDPSRLPEVVRTWQGEPVGDMETDRDRFEAIDDDEVVGSGMDIDEDEPMDLS